jgi:hypothetical protein
MLSGAQALTRTSQNPKRIEKLTDDELALVGGFYKRSVGSSR